MELTKIAVVLACFWAQCLCAPNKPIKAIAVLTINDGSIQGNITFNQASCTEPTHVTIVMEGLKPGHHGFHIHELGNIAGGCASTGSHFNPEAFNHGGIKSEVRHVGDLGNIVADETGTVKDTFSDNLISLAGKNSIVGRAVVVHADQDDNGEGGDLESTKTGNAGARLACGVIGLAEGMEDYTPECDGAATITLLTSTFLAAFTFITLFNRLF